MEGGPLTPEELIVNYAGGRVQELNPFAQGGGGEGGGSGAGGAAACADPRSLGDARELLLSENPNAPGRG